MKKILRALVLTTLATLSTMAASTAFADKVPDGITSSPSLKDDLIGELMIMRNIYAEEYAPAGWKKLYANWDLDTQINQAIAAANAQTPLTQKGAQKILFNFVASMKDYHTTIRFLSTESASLPLSIKGANGHFYIVYIDRAKLTSDAFPFNVGDEVVTFGGKPTADAVAEVQAEGAQAIASTDKALAEINLTNRRAARAFQVPQGPVILGIKAQGSNQIVNEELDWNYTPEKIAPRPGALLGAFSEEIALPKANSFFHFEMNAKLADAPSSATPYDLGGRVSFTPALGTKIWQSASDSQFDAYIFKNTDGKLIGYVRIPQYEADDYNKAVSAFSDIITLFESTTDGMVIDQVNNPGGSVFYLYALASMLAKDSLYTPQHRMAITQTDVSAALAQLDQLKDVTDDASAKKVLDGTMDGFPASYEAAQFTRDYCHFIINQWSAGKKLSDPYFIGGADRINPAPVHYTKPILLLINHLDFSGGDFFPTILQDNKRVTILGSRTSGAGGYVNDVTVPNDLGIDAFRATESIAERINQTPIENLGVTPDIGYEMVEEDYAQNYGRYVKAIQNALSDITK